jgi:hypothetical protein
MAFDLNIDKLGVIFTQVNEQNSYMNPDGKLLDM